MSTFSKRMKTIIKSSTMFKITQEPTIVPGDFTQLLLMYESDIIEVQKEEEVYPFLSLVADCGGVLGLFIGFNFLMVWDGTVFALTSLKHIIKSKGTVNMQEF